MDEATWGALTLTLTLIGVIWTWRSVRRGGVVAGLRPAGFTLLPAAAYLTGTLEMFTRISAAVADWATSLVFHPFVWVGVVLAGVSALLFGAAGLLGDRVADRDAVAPPRKRGLGRGHSADPAVSTDDDLADIEAILRRRGIT
ncbi:hypothetical protein [Nocardioides sp.]|uniref:hypothetical protein n=1 Tax=Nocardioides sp. TaxID=35761 RepID=UPI0035659282